MSSHDIPDDCKNSDLRYAIDEYARSERNQEILRDKWFHGLSLYDISNKYDLSLTAVKRVAYDIGDKIMLKAMRK